jgi:hypothetical protein
MLSTSSKSYNDSADLSYNKCQEARHNISSAIAHIADLLIYREGENREMILGRRCCTVYTRQITLSSAWVNYFWSGIKHANYLKPRYNVEGLTRIFNTSKFCCSNMTWNLTPGVRNTRLTNKYLETWVYSKRMVNDLGAFTEVQQQLSPIDNWTYRKYKWC